MCAKLVRLEGDIYERLQARRRENESPTELVNRLLDGTAPDWREGFGTLPEAETEVLAELVEESRGSDGSDTPHR